MSTALAVNRSEVQTHMGAKVQVAAIRDRIMAMMPGAADAPQDVQWAAAQLAVAHDLNPFNGEIYIMKIGSKKVGERWVEDWRAHIGVKGLRKLARKQANFMTEARVMDAAEVKAHRRDAYDNDDIGVEVTLWRLDVAMQCKQADVPYKPVKAVGFWRVKANYHSQKKEWMPDNIPNTWSAQMVAEKRAEINAIKQAFDMVIHVADPSQEIDELAHHVEVLDRDEAPVVGSGRSVDDDMLFATPRGRAVVQPETAEDDYADYGEAPEDAPGERELVTLVKAAIAAVIGPADADAHIAEIEDKKKKAMADMSDKELQGWLSWLQTQADKQPA